MVVDDLATFFGGTPSTIYSRVNKPSDHIKTRKLLLTHTALCSSLLILCRPLFFSSIGVPQISTTGCLGWQYPRFMDLPENMTNATMDYNS